MTEFEVATLALQKWQMLAAFAIPVVGLIQAGIVILGIVQMRRAGDQRAAREDARHMEAMAAHEQAMAAHAAAHAEAMAAHTEAMAAHAEAMATAKAAHATTMRALEALIERNRA